MDKNNLGIIKDMAKLFSATILSGLFFTGCVDMDLTPKNQPSEGEVWADATMAEQTVTGLYNGLNHLYNDNYNMWFDCFSAVMDAMRTGVTLVCCLATRRHQEMVRVGFGMTTISLSSVAMM